MVVTGDMTLILVEDSNSETYGNNRAEFVFKACSPVSRTKVQPTLDLGFFSQNGQQTSRIRFASQKESVTFSFALYNVGDDRSNGTGAGSEFGSTVVTVAQQIQYLFDIIYSADIKASWLITDNNGRFFEDTESRSCFIEDLKIDNAPGSTALVTGNITLSMGTPLSLASIFS